MTGDWRDAWIGALDELEANVEVIEEMIKEEHRIRDLPEATPWAPPRGIGPIPQDLRSRAEEILARQMEAAKAAALAITANRRQTAFAAKVEVGTPGKAIPSYVDCAM
ncbi:hypothetical protein EV385_2223 [Krasilnikovia cinnamomea]|uniref:Uncharacterized protein n=1 Tax=Krasilnikovia cinnamomea TaxID=349313 RepID=A0A4Q7ZIZ7_9ACTN|nr:hypothetical protein [Krasilnikovia cinnamomea]RZU50451.1 hypothetical protein EV385_2223 [Krasilnikovia cinnamomea]